MPIQTIVKPYVYFDSLVLMQLSTELAERPGVSQAVVMMGTRENKASIRNHELLTDDVARAGPNDLFVVVEGDSMRECQDAIAHAVRCLESPRVRRTKAAHKTLSAALRRTADANLVSISVPGRYAAAEARRALDAGMHVFLFSDNVRIEEEIELKRHAATRNLLVMGPDCGTAIIGGAGLGFANGVRRGRIGVVGASGTGIQEVTTLIHRCGCGVTEAIGTGTNDVSDEVGGRTLLAGLHWFASDPDTDVILVVSKPSSASVTRRVEEIAARCRKPVIMNLLGSVDPGTATGDLLVAETLEEASLLGVSLSESRAAAVVQSELYDSVDLKRLAQVQRARLSAGQVFFRGLFSGGTFANESAALLRRNLGDQIYGNIALQGVKALDDPWTSVEHTCVDLGEEVFTVGKPHPILAPVLRRERLFQEAGDPTTAVVVLDIVLGYGTHSDPAAEFAGYIQKARGIAAREGRHLPVVVNVCGTEEDPQRRSSQVRELQQAGAIVAPTNAAATRLAIGILAGRVPDAELPSSGGIGTGAGGISGQAAIEIPREVNVINVGLLAFGDSLGSQGVSVTQVDFNPPAGGDEEAARLLEEML